MENHAFAPERYSLSLCCDLSLHVRRRKLGSLLHRHYWACAATSHERTHAHAHTRRQAGRQTCMHAGYGIHLCSYVSAIINKSEIADTPLRIPSDQRRREAGGAEDWDWTGALKEGVPNWQPSVPITSPAVTAARETPQTPREALNNAGSPVFIKHLH